MQVRRVSGSMFTSEDTLEVRMVDSEGPLEILTHTIDIISGPNITHGGGGQPGEYLHYKSLERDADGDGNIDYSLCEIPVKQESKGDSVIIVTGKYCTKAEIEAHEAALSAWQTKMQELTELAEVEALEKELPVFEFSFVSTSEVTLSWGDDDFS